MRKLKIFVIGTRGVPDIPGGVEKHCQELYPRIVKLGHEVILVTRKSYVTQHLKEWNGIKLIHCYSPKIKSLEAVLHTFFAVILARIHNPDILHVHAIGPALLIPFAKLLGLKVVITNHGPDYDRQKWGKFAKLILKLGEYLGSRFADEIIAISNVIINGIKEKYNKTPHLIYNGVSIPDIDNNSDYIESLGIKPKMYALSVARLVPEKGLHDLIKAFQNTDFDGQIVIAGDADHETEYSKNLKESAKQDKRIILTGYITGKLLKQVFSNAKFFVLPSYHEGLPIALLEALSYNLPVLVSNIPANCEVDLNAECYFNTGNISELSLKLLNLFKKIVDKHECEKNIELLLEKYDWDKIAEQTVKVYEQVLSTNTF